MTWFPSSIMLILENKIINKSCKVETKVWGDSALSGYIEMISCKIQSIDLWSENFTDKASLTLIHVFCSVCEAIKSAALPTN